MSGILIIASILLLLVGFLTPINDLLTIPIAALLFLLGLLRFLKRK
ncbi:hypothetical protein IM538_12935 [Cytobacillus suaedae]|nr:hypothetical protein IM538_12935 [Cytobacillus suaedae]